MSTNRNELAVGEMASLLTTDYAPVVALERLVAHAVDCVDASLGVLLIADADDTMHVLAAIPDSHVRHADLASSAPAVESARHGSIVLVDDVTDDNRWPRFNESATAAGIRGARAFPSRLEQRALGSLTLYTAEPWGTARNSVTAQTLALWASMPAAWSSTACSASFGPIARAASRPVAPSGSSSVELSGRTTFMEDKDMHLREDE